jgi:hypothetical protein
MAFGYAQMAFGNADQRTGCVSISAQCEMQTQPTRLSSFSTAKARQGGIQLKTLAPEF